MRLGAGGLDRIAVSGLGPVGLLATQFAIAMGAEVIGIDPVESPPPPRLGARRGRHARPDGRRDRRGRQALWPDGADKLVETSGRDARARGDLPDRAPDGHGRAGRLGNPIFQTSLNEITRWEITVFGSTIYPMSQWDTLTDFVRRKQIDLDAWSART